MGCQASRQPTNKFWTENACIWDCCQGCAAMHKPRSVADVSTCFVCCVVVLACVCEKAIRHQWARRWLAPGRRGLAWRVRPEFVPMSSACVAWEAVAAVRGLSCWGAARLSVVRAGVCVLYCQTAGGRQRGWQYGVGWTMTVRWRGWAVNIMAHPSFLPAAVGYGQPLWRSGLQPVGRGPPSLAPTALSVGPRCRSRLHAQSANPTLPFSVSHCYRFEVLSITGISLYIRSGHVYNYCDHCVDIKQACPTWRQPPITSTS